MTHSELHELLDSEKPLTLAQVEKAVEEMKHDVENENYRLVENSTANSRRKKQKE